MEAASSTARSTFLTNQDVRVLGKGFWHFDDLFLPKGTIDMPLVATRNAGRLRAALTSNAFLEAGRDALWKTMHSVMPLLKILPAFETLDWQEPVTPDVYIQLVQLHKENLFPGLRRIDIPR